MFEILRRGEAALQRKWPTVTRRVLAIIGAVTLAWAISAIVAIWLLPITAEAKQSVFSAWLGELAFFSLVGLVVALASLREPTQEGFLERVRILYGGVEHPAFVIENNAKIIRTLGGYATEGHRRLIIEEWRSDIQAYKIRVITQYKILNMFRDVEYHDTIKIKMIPDIFGDENQELGRVNSISICGKEVLKRPEIITKDGFNADFPMQIAAGATEIFSVETMIWSKVGEENRLRPQRPVARFSMDIVSHIEHTPILSIQGGGLGSVNLTYGNVTNFPDVHGVIPGEAIFAFTLQPPLE